LRRTLHITLTTLLCLAASGEAAGLAYSRFLLARQADTITAVIQDDIDNILQLSSVTREAKACAARQQGIGIGIHS
jgi:hypothetical protein